MPDDKIRSKSAELLAHALIGNDGDDATMKDKCTRLASETEQQIFVHHGGKINNDYKEAIRSHVLNLKDTKNNLRSRLLSDQLNAITFADMGGQEMAAPERRMSDEKLRRNSIRDSMVVDNLQPMHRDQEDPDRGRD